MDPRFESIASWAAASPDLVAILIDARVVYANEAAHARWPGAAGSLARELFPEDTRARFEEAARAALVDARGTTFEWGARGLGGVEAWFASTVARGQRDLAGALVLVCHDVTALKRSEERLLAREKLIVDTQGVAHLGVWEWDVREPHATWSDELYRIYGLTREEYVPSYEAYLTKVHPDDRQRVIDATNRVFHEHVPYSHDERVFRPDGSIRYLHTWAYPVLDAGGTLVRLVGVCQDITDRKLAEEEVLRLNADLERRVAERTRTIEQSLRDLESFQAMLSHDLRAPLSVIRGSTRLLLDARSQLDGPTTKNVERIERAGVQMTRLVDDLLTLAQVGNCRLERGRVDLTALCEDVIAHLRRTTPDRRVDVAIAPNLACEADASLVRTVLDNLLSNAWKYSSRVAEARIVIGEEEVDGVRAYFVRDNGAGFDERDAHRLFTPFERLHRSEFPGTGVGLAAVNRIIERHGGKIWAKGAPGAGATFWFTLG